MDKNSDQIILKDFVEKVVEATKKEIQKDVEPIDNYVNVLRSRLHSDVNAFQDRFVQGYDVLIETLHALSKK